MKLREQPSAPSAHASAPVASVEPKVQQTNGYATPEAVLEVGFQVLVCSNFFQIASNPC